MTHVRITAVSDIPLVGSLYFGIIDRGTSLLQVRPSCGCNLNCPFCSVDAGPESTTRATSYEVELEYLLSAVEEIAPFKGTGVECHIDSPGEPLMYARLPELVAALKAIDAVSTVSLQTNGTLLDEKKIAALAEAGLDRVNLSLHAIDPALAKELAGVEWYDIGKVTDAARAVAASSTDLLIAPVFMPGINDAEIPKLIEFARECGAGKRFPPLGIQKFERYRYGRTPKGVKVQSWWQFFNRSIRNGRKRRAFTSGSIRAVTLGRCAGPRSHRCLPREKRRQSRSGPPAGSMASSLALPGTGSSRFFPATKSQDRSG